MSSDPDDPAARLPPRWVQPEPGAGGDPAGQRHEAAGPPSRGNQTSAPSAAIWRSVSVSILALNVAVWLLITITGGSGSLWADRLGLRRIGICVAPGDTGTYFPGLGSASACNGIGLWLPGASDGAPWQVLTSAFTQIEATHLGLNMLALVMLGPVLERALGRARFVLVYLGSALCGSAAVYLLTPPQSLTVGASGAIFGLLGSLLVTTWWLGGEYRGVLIWLAINVGYTFVGGNISWQGHLGGLLGGLAITLALLARTPRRRRAPT